MSALRVSVYANGAFVGHADLRPVDPETGTYGGPFNPGEGYAAVRPVVLELMRRTWPRQQAESAAHLREAYRRHDALALEVRTEAGEPLHPSAVYVEDAGGVWTDAVPRVELLGLPDEEARRHFGGGAGGRRGG
ncbi:MAG TPA: hypothetical protein VK002_11790 [Rubricoccaceae bacterium]|nr:hypothetical protein [Rubricoccaceae bacterium]